MTILKKIYKIVFIEDYSKLDHILSMDTIGSTIVIINIASVFRFVMIDENKQILKDNEMDIVDIEGSMNNHFDKIKYLKGC